MASFLKFYLDVEVNAEIIAPKHTTIGAITYITVINDTEMAKINIKIVDALGEEHLYLPVFTNSSQHTFEMLFADFPLGITTIYISVLDVLDNSLDLAPKTFEIFKSTSLFIKLSDSPICKSTLLDSEPFRISLSDKGDK